MSLGGAAVPNCLRVSRRWRGGGLWSRTLLVVAMYPLGEAWVGEVNRSYRRRDTRGVSQFRPVPMVHHRSGKRCNRGALASCDAEAFAVVSFDRGGCVVTMTSCW